MKITGKERKRKGKGTTILLLLAIILTIMNVFTVQADSSDDIVCANPTVVTLYGGRQNIEVGRVTVWNDIENLYVSYKSIDRWVMTETDLYVGKTDPKELTSAPGQFPYSETHDPSVSEYTYIIPLSEIDSYHLLESGKRWVAEKNNGVEPGDENYIAAHAVVQKIHTDRNCKQKETAWGDGYDFPSKKRATYFSYVVQDCFKNLNIPKDTVKMKVYNSPGSSNNYCDLELSDIPQDYDVYDGVWTGWCADSQVYILGVTYNVSLFSSYDSDMPEHVQDDERWDLVNYLLNHKHPEATWREIQAAIWYFTDDDPNYQDYFTDKSQAMIDDALANGEDFVPLPSQITAVIVDAGTDVQMTFIEVGP